VVRDVLTRSQEHELRSVTAISRSAANYSGSSRTTKDKIEHLETVCWKLNYVKSVEVIEWIHRQLDLVESV
jgi:hypothetical protein